MDGSEQTATPAISIVIPALNESIALPSTLATCVSENNPHEIVVVDGGSTDGTRERAMEFFSLHPVIVSKWIESMAGRARQMNAGANRARGDVLLFLHADTQLPGGALDGVRTAIRRGAVWGRFDVRLSGQSALFRVVERFMNWRSRLTGMATGDQAIFVRRDAFRVVGGFGELPLMEDIDLCARLRIFGPPACLRQRVVTSSRRWEQHGIVCTVLRMWTLRLLYLVGVPPARLAHWYR